MNDSINKIVLEKLNKYLLKYVTEDIRKHKINFTYNSIIFKYSYESIQMSYNNSSINLFSLDDEDKEKIINMENDDISDEFTKIINKTFLKKIITKLGISDEETKNLILNTHIVKPNFYFHDIHNSNLLIPEENNKYELNLIDEDGDSFKCYIHEDGDSLKCYIDKDHSTNISSLQNKEDIETKINNLKKEIIIIKEQNFLNIDEQFLYIDNKRYTIKNKDYLSAGIIKIESKQQQETRLKILEEEKRLKQEQEQEILRKAKAVAETEKKLRQQAEAEAAAEAAETEKKKQEQEILNDTKKEDKILENNQKQKNIRQAKIKTLADKEEEERLARLKQLKQEEEKPLQIFTPLKIIIKNHNSKIDNDIMKTINTTDEYERDMNFWEKLITNKNFNDLTTVISRIPANIFNKNNFFISNLSEEQIHYYLTISQIEEFDSDIFNQFKEKQVKALGSKMQHIPPKELRCMQDITKYFSDDQIENHLTKSQIEEFQCYHLDNFTLQQVKALGSKIQHIRPDAFNNTTKFIQHLSEIQIADYLTPDQIRAMNSNILDQFTSRQVKALGSKIEYIDATPFESTKEFIKYLSLYQIINHLTKKQIKEFSFNTLDKLNEDQVIAFENKITDIDSFALKRAYKFKTYLGLD